MKKREKKEKIVQQTVSHKSNSVFHIEFKNESQKKAWQMFQEHDVLFLSGKAGTAKTFLATAFAISECLTHKKKIIIARPIVDAGEKLGYLPGDFKEKVDPYMRPIYDCMDKILGVEGEQREKVKKYLEIAPLAYLRGRTFDNAVCLLDEAQNANMKQLVLFVTRLGEGSKLILTGDPDQSDIIDSGYAKMMDAFENTERIGILRFAAESIVRHPLVGKMLEKMNIGIS